MAHRQRRARGFQGGEQPDAVVTDLVMPGLSGSELRRAVERIRPGLPFVYMSGGDDPAAAACLEGPILRKPFSEEALASRVLEALACATGAPAPGPAGGAA